MTAVSQHRIDRPTAGGPTGKQSQQSLVVIIDDDCRPLGIVTSTDYVELTAGGIDPYDTTIGEYMTTDIVTVRPGEEVGMIAERMTENDVSHLPVVDDEEQVVGIVSTTDLAVHLVPDEGDA